VDLLGFCYMFVRDLILEKFGVGGSFDVRLVVSMRLLWCLFDG
jgi:hypothetical protein